MYEETACFDPNSPAQVSDDGLCRAAQPPPPPLVAGGKTNGHNNYEENLTLSGQHHLQDDVASIAAMELQLQNQQMGFHTHLVQDSLDPILSFNSSKDSIFSPTPDFLSFLHIPRCSSSSLLPNPNPRSPFADLSMTDTPSASSILYDTLFHLNLPPQPPLFMDLFHSLPCGGGRGGGDDNVEGSGGGMCGDGDCEQLFDNGGLDFTWDMDCVGKGRDNGKMTKHLATERQRRQHFNDKFQALRNLIPNPTKNDRASVVGDAIEYIKELLRTVNELKILVQKKRCARQRNKRQKTTEQEEECAGREAHESFSAVKSQCDQDQSLISGSLRSSWLQRKSKDTEVDVRIVDDEVTIKLVQRKKISSLLFVSKVLDELQLDLLHVAGGHIGDYYSFFFNTKIYEGSSVYASAIANKLMEVADRNYVPTHSTSWVVEKCDL